MIKTNKESNNNNIIFTFNRKSDTLLKERERQIYSDALVRGWSGLSGSKISHVTS